MEERMLDEEEEARLKEAEAFGGEADTDGDDLAEFSEIKFREHTRREYARLMREGCAAIAENDFEGAEKAFFGARIYGDSAALALWAARTKFYRDASCFYDEETAREFADEKETDFGRAARAEVFENMGSALRGEYRAVAEEENKVRLVYEAEQNERREAFLANNNYYLFRFLICLGVFALVAVAAIVSASFLVRVQSALPLILLLVFSALSLIPLGVAIVYARGLYSAQKLCRENEKLTSTENGTRLKALQDRLRCLTLLDIPADGAASSDGKR